MNATSLLQKNGNAAAAHSQQWLQASVREFFLSVNWEDQAPALQELTQSHLQGTATSLSLTLSVKQFFATFPWDGAMMATPAAVEIPSTDATPADGFTLDDFSSLF